jgi:hypothetical protein
MLARKESYVAADLSSFLTSRLFVLDVALDV